MLRGPVIDPVFVIKLDTVNNEGIVFLPFALPFNPCNNRAKYAVSTN